MNDNLIDEDSAKTNEATSEIAEAEAHTAEISSGSLLAEDVAVEPAHEGLEIEHQETSEAVELLGTREVTDNLPVETNKPEVNEELPTSSEVGSGDIEETLEVNVSAVTSEKDEAREEEPADEIDPLEDLREIPHASISENIEAESVNEPAEATEGTANPLDGEVIAEQLEEVVTDHTETEASHSAEKAPEGLTQEILENGPGNSEADANEQGEMEEVGKPDELETSDLNKDIDEVAHVDIPEENNEDIIDPTSEIPDEKEPQHIIQHSENSSMQTPAKGSSDITIGEIDPYAYNASELQHAGADPSEPSDEIDKPAAKEVLLESPEKGWGEEPSESSLVEPFDGGDTAINEQPTHPADSFEGTLLMPLIAVQEPDEESLLIPSDEPPTIGTEYPEAMEVGALMSAESLPHYDPASRADQALDEINEQTDDVIEPQELVAEEAHHEQETSMDGPEEQAANLNEFKEELDSTVEATTLQATSTEESEVTGSPEYETTDKAVPILPPTEEISSLNEPAPQSTDDIAPSDAEKDYAVGLDDFATEGADPDAANGDDDIFEGDMPIRKKVWLFKELML